MNNLEDNEVIEQITKEFESDTDLINATQNVIINAAENVSDVLDISANADVIVNNHPFFIDVEFWVGMSFVLAIIVLLKPMRKFINNALQNKIDNVKKDIEEAKKLRDDAQQLLANYERKFINTEAEVAKILNQSKENLKNLQDDEISKVNSFLKNKKKEVDLKIAVTTKKIRDEINFSASSLAIDYAKNTIEKFLVKTDKSQLIDDAITDLDIFRKKSL